MGAPLANFSYKQPYIVVGGLVVRDDKFLLLKENHYPDKGKWNIPAGKLDYGETLSDGAIREVFEEAGMKFKPEHIVGIHTIYRKDVPNEQGTTHVMRIIFSGQAEGEASNENGDDIDGIVEIEDFKWMSAEEVDDISERELRYHDIKKLVRNYCDRKFLPLSSIQHLIQVELEN